MTAMAAPEITDAHRGYCSLCRSTPRLCALCAAPGCTCRTGRHPNRPRNTRPAKEKHPTMPTPIRAVPDQGGISPRLCKATPPPRLGRAALALYEEAVTIPEGDTDWYRLETPAKSTAAASRACKSLADADLGFEADNFGTAHPWVRRVK